MGFLCRVSCGRVRAVRTIIVVIIATFIVIATFIITTIIDITFIINITINITITSWILYSNYVNMPYSILQYTAYGISLYLISV